MRNYTHEEKLKWIDNAKYPKLEDGKYAVRIPAGMEKVLNDALESNEWKTMLGRKPRQKAALIVDMCMLLYDLVHYDLWTGESTYNIKHYVFRDHELDLVPMEERVFDLRFDQGSLQPLTHVTQLSPLAFSSSKNPILYHRGGDSQAKCHSKKRTKQLEERGFKSFSMKTLRRYYDDRKKIEVVLAILCTPYCVKGRNTERQILQMQKHGSRRFVRIDPYLLNQRHHGVLLERACFATGYCNYVRMKWEEMIADPLLSQEYANWMELMPPSREAVWNALQASVGGVHHGKKIVSLADTPKPLREEEREGFVWIEDWMESADRYAFDHGRPVLRSWRAKRGESCRHYSAYNMMPSMVRKLFKWKGRRLVWIDVNGCHLILLMTKYSKDSDANPMEIERVMDILNSPHPRKRIAELAGREDDPWFKEALLSWINCPTWMMLEGVDGAKYQDITTIMDSIGLDGLVKWLMKWKINAGHEAISYWLQGEESKLMDTASMEATGQGIFTLGCHDGIDCDPDRVDDVCGIIRNVFQEHGYACSLKDDRDENHQDVAA